MKGTKAMIELISRALSAGIEADYVLFDTWFSSPAQLLDIKKLGLDAIAMIRKSSKIRYIYEGKKLNLNKIYGMNKKRRGRSRYLLSVNVEIQLLLLHTLTGDIEDTMIRQMFLGNSRSMSGHHGLP